MKKKTKKYNTGGPLIKSPPKDTTRVDPRKLATVTTPQRVSVKGNDGETSSKSKSFDRFRERSLGGDIIKTGVSFIPGVGQILAPIAGLIDNELEKDKASLMQPEPKLNINKNPFGQLALGGIINDQFKQYNTGSHESGNDLTIDETGDANPQGQNSVQNDENAYEVNGKPYIMSDKLTNPKTGNKINKDASLINKKYPKARFIIDQKNALDLEMKALSAINDVERAKVESKSNGQLTLGGGPDDPKVPASDNLNWAAIPNQDLFPSTKSLTMPNLNVLPSVTEQKYGMQKTPGMLEADKMGTDRATDPTTFGTELTPAGANLSEPGVQVEDRGDPLAAKKSESDILGAKTANAIGLGAKGLALAGSIGDALSPAEEEKLITPDYQKSDAYMKSANVDYTQAKQDVQGVSNIAAGTNRSLSSNAASYQGREMARLGNLSDQMGRISEAENNAQSQLDLTKGQYEQNKAVDTANRKYQNQQGNMQNQANARFFDRTLASDLSQIGSSFNEYGETQKVIANNKEVNEFQVNQALAILNSKYPNVKITPDIMQKLKEGATIDEILKVSI